MLKAIMIASVLDVITIIVLYLLNIPINSIGAILIGIMNWIIGMVISNE